MADSDEQLAERAKRGDAAAFDGLVRRYRAELYGYLRRYLRNEHLADDVFQNTFLAVYQKLDQHEAGRPVRPWLYTVATRQAIDAMRRVGRRPAASLNQAGGDDGDGALRDLIDLIESRGPATLDLMEQDERRQFVRDGVDALPDLHRQILTLAYYQGLPYKEISDILGIPVGTVKSRVHVALLKLQQRWQSAGVEPP